MKKLTRILLVFVVFASLMSCKKGPDKLMVGKWKLTEISGPNLTDEAQKQDFYNRVSFNFTDKGAYEIVGLKEGGDQGTWSVSEDGKQLTTKSVDGKGDISSIVEISETKLVLTQAENKMVFKKVE